MFGRAWLHRAYVSCRTTLQRHKLLLDHVSRVACVRRHGSNERMRRCLHRNDLPDQSNVYGRSLCLSAELHADDGCVRCEQRVWVGMLGALRSWLHVLEGNGNHGGPFRVRARVMPESLHLW